MSSNCEFNNVKVKTEKTSAKDWGGIPPSVLLDDSAKKNSSAASRLPSRPSVSCNDKDDITVIPVCETEATEDSSIPAIDAKSIDGKFGWTKVNDVDLPFLLRGDDHFVSVRMIELKLLKIYFQTLPMQLFTIARVNSEYVTTNEAALLNEINVKHCDCKFGKMAFTRYDLIVQEDAVKEMCEFLNNCHLITLGVMDKAKKRCGILSIGHVRVPYVVSENSQWVPSDFIPSPIKLSCAIEMTVSKWQMGYLQLCCSLAKLNDSAINENTKILRVQDITAVDGTELKMDEIPLLSYVKPFVNEQNNTLPSNAATVLKSQKSDRLHSLMSQPSSNVNGSASQRNSNWMSSVNSSIPSSHISSVSKRHSPVAPASKSKYLPPYSPNSPMVAPSPQQLSPSVEPVITPPYSHHLSHLGIPYSANYVNPLIHAVPSISSSIMKNQSSSLYSANQRLNKQSVSCSQSSTNALIESLQNNSSNNNLPNSQESHSHPTLVSSLQNEMLRKRTHDSHSVGPPNYASNANSINHVVGNHNPEFISLPSSFIDIDEFSSSAPKKSSLPSSNASSVATSMFGNSQPQNFIIIPDPVRLDDRLPPYSVSQVSLESCMLPAINTKAYSYSEALMIPLFYVSYKFFPEISIEVCQQALRQILCVNLFTSNKYITQTLGKVCRLPQHEDKTTLIRWDDLQTIFSQLRIIMSEISRRLIVGNSSSELSKHLELIQSIKNNSRLQMCDRLN